MGSLGLWVVLLAVWASLPPPRSCSPTCARADWHLPLAVKYRFIRSCVAACPALGDCLRSRPRGAQTNRWHRDLCGRRCSAKLNESYGSLALLSWTGKKLPCCEVLQSRTTSTSKQPAPGGTQKATSRNQPSTSSH